MFSISTYRLGLVVALAMVFGALLFWSGAETGVRQFLRKHTV